MELTLAAIAEPLVSIAPVRVMIRSLLLLPSVIPVVVTELMIVAIAAAPSYIRERCYNISLK